MKPGKSSLQTHQPIRNARMRSMLATCGALALALGVAACGQQDAQQGATDMAKQGMEKAKQTGKKAMQGAQKSGKNAMQGAKKAAGKAMGGAAGAGAAGAGAKSMADKAPSPKFLSLDTNGDGQLSAGEISSNPMMKKNMKKLDGNGDGQLNPAEFAKAASGMMGSSKSGGSSSSGGSTENPNRPTN